MSRSRNIKPGFFKNELLVELPFEVRLLFIGLWTMADREGRLEDRPIKIKMEVFPADSVDVNAGLQSLHDKGFLKRYQINGDRYIQINAFSKHQNPHKNEIVSVIPAPPKIETPDNIGTTPDLSRAVPILSEPLGLIPDSLLLIPESIKTTLADSPPVVVKPVEPKPEKPKAEKPAKVLEFTEAFTAFWNAYPKRRREKKAEAFKVWKQEKFEAESAVIVAHVTAQSKTHEWKRESGQFAPQPPAYLRGKRWLDGVGETASGERGPVGASPTVQKTAEQVMEQRIIGLRDLWQRYGNESARAELETLGVRA